MDDGVQDDGELIQRPMGGGVTDSGQHGPESRSRTGEDGYFTLGQGGSQTGRNGEKEGED